MKWYYYDANGDKIGPVTAKIMKILADQGDITPQTIVETEDGKSALAEKVQGLFDAPGQPIPVPQVVNHDVDYAALRAEHEQDIAEQHERNFGTHPALEQHSDGSCCSVRSIIGIVILALILAGISFAIFPSQDRIGEDLEAASFAKREVQKLLIAPSEAEFEMLPQVMYSEKNKTYRVTGWVDAKNAVGVKIRYDYLIDAEKVGREWRLVEGPYLNATGSAVFE